LDKTVTHLAYSAAKQSGRSDSSRAYAGWLSESSIASSAMNPIQQIGGPQVVANMPFAGDRMPQRHVEAYQQMPSVEIQPVHR
jgi:hypothetical protein